ncbi:polysaccharide deacetylase family protein [Aestuariispira ectoiniformans]|uniref:polysaccharide deacetylase family protein n=1 Tax=Aestuariispira ectoiniformans TaxID=2775080 RepID=UPI00223B9411|nr:polysaccharide deacetylase family protein [Aestuariispira ectoiniformans]
MIRQSSFAPLIAELDAWADAGKMAEFWWRDDDAIRQGPILDRLLLTAGKSPLALAVIPGLLEASLVDCLARHPNVSVLQHGWVHENHAGPGEKKAEFRLNRPIEVMLDEIGQGYQKLEMAFGPRFAPVFVPPWNRVAEELAARLPDVGLTWLSVFTPRTGRELPPPRINTHVDPIDWHGTRGFLGMEQTLNQAIAHLRMKRLGLPDIDITEPTGLLTHHTVHDGECWAFLNNFNMLVRDHPAARWVDIRDLVQN